MKIKKLSIFSPNLINVYCLVCILLSISEPILAQKCARSFVTKMSDKYTQSKYQDFFEAVLHSPELSAEPLGAGGNGIAFRIPDYQGEALVQKFYKPKENIIGSRAKLPLEEKNLAADLARFRFYEKLIEKYSLDFRVVDRFNAKDNILLSKYVDGMSAIKLFQFGMLEEVERYNKMILSSLDSLLIEIKRYKGKVSSFEMFYEIPHADLEKINNGHELNLEIVRNLDISSKPIRIVLVAEFTNAIRHYFVLAPSNFIFDFETDQFVMIDPV